MPIFTRKFSQFLGQNVAEPVGLTASTNSIGPASGGGGGVTFTITQASPALSVGEWVTINSLGQYVAAQGDTPQDAEVVGVVIAASAPQYTIQQAGYIQTTQAVFVGLTAGNPYFLSPSSAGQMQAADVTVNGQVSRPVFYADTATSGWVLPYRGVVFNGTPGPGGGGGSVVDTNIQTIISNNTFSPGQAIRVTTPSGGVPTYTLAKADILGDAQSIGIVTAGPGLGGGPQFTVQFGGYNTGTVNGTYVDTAFTPANVLYLSATTAGNLTPTQPSVYSKPMYIPDGTTATTGTNSGWILPQRPLATPVALPGASPPVFLGQLNVGNGFSSTSILSGYNSYWIIANGLGIFEASGGGITNFGFQFYYSVSGWSTIPAYFHYFSGVNSSANPTTTGVLYGDVNNSGTLTMAVISSAVNTVASMGIFEGLLNVASFFAGSSAALNFQNIVTDNTGMPLPNGVGYTASGVTGGGSGTGNLTGIRLIAGGGATISASFGTPALLIYGIPNS